MRVLLYGRQNSLLQPESLQVLFETLKRYGIEVDIYYEIQDQVSGSFFDYSSAVIFDHSEFVDRRPDIVLSLGGDGTILSSATLVKDAEVPVMGINFGRLGFLSSVEQQEITQAIEVISKRQYKRVNRTMLYLESDREIFGEDRFALNEMTILKRDNSSMITVRAFVNGEYLTSYWGDGLIVATPTGSTAYSLSCGGPIVFPDSGNFVITPVAPHNLSLRPIILSDNSVISFEIEGRDHTYMCTLDGRMETITAQHQIAVRKSDAHFVLAELPSKTFMRTMREKLTWGKDQRN